MINREIDQELLHSFTVEAKTYLIETLRGVADFHRDPARTERFEDAHRRVDMFKGAAVMVGLVPLSEAALQLEETFEKIATGNVSLSGEAVMAMSEMVAQIGAYLDEVAEGRLDEPDAMGEARRVLQRVSQPAKFETATTEKRPQAGGNSPASANEVVDQPSPQSAAFAGISADLLEIFLTEAEEHLRVMTLTLPVLAEQPNHKELLQTVRRSAHSLKGSAAMVGVQEIAQLAHRMEDLLDLIYDDEMALTAECLNLLFASTDALENMIDNGVDPQTLRSLYDGYSQLIESHQPEAAPEQPVQPPPSVTVNDNPAEEAPGSLAKMLQGRTSFVRVPIEQLDELVKLVTELIITRTSFEQNMEELQRQLEELRTSSSRLGRVSDKMEVQYEASALGRGLHLAGSGALNGTGSHAAAATPLVNEVTHGFDDLEFDRYTEFHLLLRGLTEATNDVQTLDHELRMVRESLESCLNRQGRLSSEIQEKLMRLRMVPLSTLSSRLARTVRTVAAQRGKSVHFTIEGEETRLDKTVIEEMADPLLHILRNAVDHGIESPAVRRAQGKPSTGTIRLKAFYDGTQIVVEIRDDGVGIDPERLRLAAIDGGYLSDSDAARVPVEDLLSLIFLPGFSTAPQVSEISGRGVGLDVASVAIRRLKGSVKVDSRPGEGATFTVRLPMTLAVMSALMVKVSHEIFAIPLVGIKQIIKIGPGEVERIGKEPVVRAGDGIYPLMSLSKLLGLRRPEERTQEARPVLLVTLEDRQVAIAVDETLGEREIVVKNLGSHLRQVHGVTGATLMGNGSVALILNLSELVREAFRPRTKLVATPAKRTAPPSRRSLTVMVVDDSLSVRRVLSNLLTSAGWKPVQARDGLDALEMLPHMNVPPDVVLLDIEMPRMDGYEFISALRKQKAYEQTPVIILTSRAGQKHREKAFELGATDYVVKPYQDEALLALIRQLTYQATPRN